MEANADSFLELIHQFEDFTDAVSPEQAHSEFDETTLQIFWMRWPQLSAWTGSLWRMLSEEMSGPSAPHTDPELDEVGKVADSPGRVLTVRDVMTTRVVTTSPDEPVADAAAAMVRQKVGSALIMQGRFLAGILTERDVLRAAASGGDLTTSPVSAWMTKDPEQASPDTTIEDALQLMLLHGFRHLPVLAGREVRGVVSLRDLAAVRITRHASRG